MTARTVGEARPWTAIDHPLWRDLDLRSWRQVRAVLMLPISVTLLIPTLILARSQRMEIGWLLPSPWNALPVGAGLILIAAGLTLMYQTIRLFGSQGHGTLAPWDPPRRLVVVGVYRHVRNPMISGVFSILLGESILFGSAPLFGWFAAFLAINLTYIPLLEEPRLAHRFGTAYRIYQAHVPRWIPRRRAWQGVTNQHDVEHSECDR